MIKTILICIGAATVGLIPLAFLVLLIGLAGMPGYAIVGNRTDDVGLRSLSGYLLAFFGHLYTALTVVAFVVSGLRQLTAQDSSLIPWVLWVAGFLWSVLPVFAVASRAFKDESPIQAAILVWVGFIAAVGFIVFALFPVVARPWNWLPWA